MSLAEKISGLRQVAETEAPPSSKSKKKEMKVIDLTGTDIEKDIIAICESGYFLDQLSPHHEQRKSQAQTVLFDLWIKEMWASKCLPENFKAKVNKTVKGKSTNFIDVVLNFIVKFRVDAINKKLATDSGKPIHQVLIETLISIGLSPDNAQRFAQEEFEVKEKMGLAQELSDLQEVLNLPESDDMRVIADFIVSCLTAETKKDHAKIPLLTLAQRKKSIRIVQEYSLKSGYQQRLLSYVDTIEQLKALLGYLEVTKQISNFDCGVSDDAETRTQRLKKIAEIV